MAPTSSGRFFCSALMALVPLALIAPMCLAAGALRGLAVGMGPCVAATAGGLLLGALGGASIRPRAWLDLLRRLMLVGAVSGAATALMASPPSALGAMPLLLGGLIGALAGPELTSLARALRASSRAGEEYAFQTTGVSRWALGAALASLVTIIALPTYLGFLRGLACAPCVLFPWVWWEGIAAGKTRRIVRFIVLAGAAASLAVAYLYPLRGALALPSPRELFVQRSIDAVARTPEGLTVWSRPFGQGAMFRVHSPKDFPIFVAGDEVRLAEALVHPAATMLPAIHRAVVIGNESGAVVRELLRYPEIKEVRQISLLKGASALFRGHPILRLASGGALDDPRVRSYLATTPKAIEAAMSGTSRFDLIISSPFAPLGQAKWLYSPAAMKHFESRLAPGGFVVRRLTSLAAAPAFAWCFVYEDTRAGWYSAPFRLVLTNSSLDVYLVELSSAVRFNLEVQRRIRVPTLTLDSRQLDKIFFMGKDNRPAEYVPRKSCADELGVEE